MQALKRAYAVLRDVAEFQARAATGTLAPGGIFYTPEPKDPMSEALARQEGGGHYKELAIQPVEYIHANGIGFFEGNVIKYVTRWRAKGGLEDLKKARHYIDLLLELEQPKG